MARTLTEARYGAVLVFDSSGRIEDFITSGITPEELRCLEVRPQGLGLLGYLNDVQRPVRLRDISSHPRSAGFPENHPPMKTFLGAPIRRRGENLGNIYLTEKAGGREFTLQDEETLVMFASQAAVAIANARTYREERRAKDDLEALLALSPVGVLIFDGKTRDLVSLNPETRRIVRGYHAPGHTMSELLGVLTFRRPDGRVMKPEELPTERVIRTGKPVRADEIIIHLPDGQAVTTVVNAAPILSEQGEVVSVVATIQDMTPVEELERMRSEFLGMVSHELRTPLATIKGSAASVLADSSSLGAAEMRHFFRIIDEQADRMRNLIGNLLDVTRIEAGILSVTPEPVQAAEVIDQARETFLLGGAGNRIEVDIPGDLPRMAADVQRIVQVLTNLLSNASKNSPDASTITVTVSREGLSLLITVADEGRGVSPERLPHLFKKFSRTDGEEGVPSIEATGLGLAICKGIVDAHGGRIWAESEGPGFGARFMFTIPSVEEAAEVSPNGSGRLTAGPGRTAPGRLRILAVDDERQILRHVKTTLWNAGFAPIVTADPREVEHLIDAEKPRLILLDLAMPGVDGFALMRRISNITDAPVIFLSGHSEEQVVVRALEMGAADYIVKPFSPSEMVARINSALRKGAAPAQTGPLQPYELGDLSIDYEQRLVSLGGRPVRLTATEYTLLAELSTQAGRVLTYDQLLRRVWGFDYEGTPRLLQTFVKTLRRKLGDDAKSPRYIFTEFRVGYRMVKPPEDGTGGHP